MKLRILRPNLQPLLIDAESVVVYADDGVTPIALAVVYQHGPPDFHCVATCNDPSFNQILKAMGVDSIVVPRVVQPPTLESLPEK